MSHMQIGWLAAAVCALIASRCAREFFLRVPRFFSSLALFALAWVMLLPFYGNVITSPLLPGFGSFLLVHAGGLLRAEARFRESGSNVIGVDNLSQLALLLLVPLAIPTVPFGDFFGLQPGHIQLMAGTLLGAIGYIALLFGVKALARDIPTVYRVMFVITVAYTVLEVSFLVGQLSVVSNGSGLRMPAAIAYGFALAKIVLTSVFSYGLIRFTEPKLPLRTIILRFFGIHPTHEAAPA